MYKLFALLFCILIFTSQTHAQWVAEANFFSSSLQGECEILTDLVVYAHSGSYTSPPVHVNPQHISRTDTAYVVCSVNNTGATHTIHYDNYGINGEEYIWNETKYDGNSWCIAGDFSTQQGGPRINGYLYQCLPAAKILPQALVNGVTDFVGTAFFAGPNCQANNNINFTISKLGCVLQNYVYSEYSAQKCSVNGSVINIDQMAVGGPTSGSSDECEVCIASGGSCAHILGSTSVPNGCINNADGTSTLGSCKPDLSSWLSTVGWTLGSGVSATAAPTIPPTHAPTCGIDASFWIRDSGAWTDSKGVVHATYDISVHNPGPCVVQSLSLTFDGMTNIEQAWNYDYQHGGIVSIPTPFPPGSSYTAGFIIGTTNPPRDIIPAVQVTYAGSGTPSTSAPSTSAPSTPSPPTLAPSTPAPPTSAPPTSAPSTSAPSTSAPSTAAPSTPPSSDCGIVVTASTTSSWNNNGVASQVFSLNIQNNGHKAVTDLVLSLANDGHISSSWNIEAVSLSANTYRVLLYGSPLAVGASAQAGFQVDGAIALHVTVSSATCH